MLLTVAYDGTDYCGFQRQRPGQVSIQQRLEEALEHLLGKPVRVTGAGRTDAGVHAEGQAVGFRAGLVIPVDRLPYAINQHLPADIVITGARLVPDGFHPRFSARSKVYRYTLWREPFPSPFHRRYTWHRPEPLNTVDMAAAADCLVGRHDFAAFAASGRSVGDSDTVRTLWRCDIEEAGPRLIFRLEGDGFLYKMVRGIVGTLVEVGRGRWPPQMVAGILASRDRRKAGPSAPPHGLCLEAVRYPEEALSESAEQQAPSQQP